MRALSRQEFVRRLKVAGSRRYQDRHPFTVMLNEGKLNRTQLQAWILNWFYFEQNVPLKDAAIISRCPLREVRRIWITRILEHDGYGASEGAIEGWLRLAEAAGLKRREVENASFLPDVRSAVDLYVEFARSHSWLEGVAASLTQLFLPGLIYKRINAFRRYYTWVRPEGLRYFMSLLTLAKKNSNSALNVVLTYCNNRELQEKVINAVVFMNGVLWSILDAIYTVYVVRGEPLSSSL